MARTVTAHNQTGKLVNNIWHQKQPLTSQTFPETTRLVIYLARFHLLFVLILPWFTTPWLRRSFWTVMTLGTHIVIWLWNGLPRWTEEAFIAIISWSWISPVLAVFPSCAAVAVTFIYVSYLSGEYINMNDNYSENYPISYISNNFY